MASVRKRLGTKYWFGCFVLPDGRRVQRSTKSRDKMEALQIALSWERAARKKMTVEQSRRVLSAIASIVHGEAAAEESVSDYLARWIEKKKNEIKATSAERYEAALKDFCEFIGGRSGGSLSDLTPADISKWRDKLAAGVAPATVNIALKAIKNALKDAAADGVIVESPAKMIRNLKVSRAMRAASGQERRALSSNEVKKIIAAIPENSEWRGMFLAGLFTGQRLADIACMRREDLKKDWWRFATRKTGETRAVPLAKPLAAWLKKHSAKAGEWVFPEARDAVRRSRERVGTLSNQFHGWLAKAGLVEKRNHQSRGIGRKGKRSPSGLSFHYLRHTTNTLLKAAGVQESVAMDFVGHESAAISKLYTHVPEQSLLAAARKLERALG
jgi:integrase